MKLVQLVLIAALLPAVLCADAAAVDDNPAKTHPVQDNSSDGKTRLRGNATEGTQLTGETGPSSSPSPSPSTSPALPAASCPPGCMAPRCCGTVCCPTGMYCPSGFCQNIMPPGPSPSPSPSPYPSPYPSPTSPTYASGCFSGEDNVLLETGASKAFHDLKVGDRILTATTSGNFEFADVVYLPHGPNMQSSKFVEITAAKRTIKLTSDHLIVVDPSCSNPKAYFALSSSSLLHAHEVGEGMCLLTVDGWEQVWKVSEVVASGVYSAVTTNEFLVVNGVVASPFVRAHDISHAFHHLHRAAYAWLPTLMGRA